MKQEIKEKVLNAFIGAEPDNKGIIDYMECVTPEKLSLCENDFNQALCELSRENKLKGIVFSNEDSSKPLLWDGVYINTETYDA